MRRSRFQLVVFVRAFIVVLCSYPLAYVIWRNFIFDPFSPKEKIQQRSSAFFAPINEADSILGFRASVLRDLQGVWKLEGTSTAERPTFVIEDDLLTFENYNNLGGAKSHVDAIIKTDGRERRIWVQIDGESVEISIWLFVNGFRVLVYLPSQSTEEWQSYDAETKDEIREYLGSEDINEDGHYWFSRKSRIPEC